MTITQQKYVMIKKKKTGTKLTTISPTSIFRFFSTDWIDFSAWSITLYHFDWLAEPSN